MPAPTEEDIECARRWLHVDHPAFELLPPLGKQSLDESVNTLAAEFAQIREAAQEENIVLARLLGEGGSREARLRAELQEAQREIARLERSLEECAGAGRPSTREGEVAREPCTGCYSRPCICNELNQEVRPHDSK